MCCNRYNWFKYGYGLYTFVVAAVPTIIVITAVPTIIVGTTVPTTIVLKKIFWWLFQQLMLEQLFQLGFWNINSSLNLVLIPECPIWAAKYGIFSVTLGHLNIMFPKITIFNSKIIRGGRKLTSKMKNTGNFKI